jgi:hypothetical protein
MKKCNLILGILLWCIQLADCQSYNTALGLRMGTEWGMSVRQRLYKNYAAEMLLQSSLQREETQLTILGIIHKPLISRRLNFYYGMGLHKGWADQLEVDYKDPWGIDFIAGMELTIGRINLTYDYKPAINIVGGEQTFYSQTGLSLRYVIWKRDKYFWEQNSKKRRNKNRGGLFGIFK